MKNGLQQKSCNPLISLEFNGRCERIRTFDPLHPMQVRYQAAPHTDQASNYNLKLGSHSVNQCKKFTDFKKFATQVQERQVFVF